jgi:hypothetical protein
VWLSPADGVENAGDQAADSIAAASAPDVAGSNTYSSAATGMTLPSPAAQQQQQQVGGEMQEPLRQQQQQQEQLDLPQPQQEHQNGSWQQHEQQVLLELRELGPLWPRHMAEHLVLALLPVLKTTAVPAVSIGLLLQLSSYITSSHQLNQQQHLLLAELHLDAALQLQSGKKAAGSTTGGSSGGSGSRSKGRAGAATAAGAAAAGSSGVAGAKKRILGVSGSGAAAAGASMAAAAEGAGGVAKRRRLAADAAPQAITRCQLQMQQPAVAAAAAAAGGAEAGPGGQAGEAGAATGGSKAALRKQAHAEAAALAQQQQEELQQEVSAHLRACERHLQSQVAVQARSSLLHSAGPHHLGPVKYTVQLPQDIRPDTAADANAGNAWHDAVVFLQAVEHLQQQQQQCKQRQLTDPAAAPAAAAVLLQRQQQRQPGALPGAGAAAPKQPCVFWDRSDATVNLPGKHRFVGLRPFTPKAAIPDQDAGQQQQQQQQQQEEEEEERQQSPGSLLAPWLQKARNNSILQGPIQQQDGSSHVLDAEAGAALGADQAPAAAAVTWSDLQLQVRKHWVYSRLLQVQGKLAEADAEGKVCLQALQRLGQLSRNQPPTSAAADANAGLQQQQQQDGVPRSRVVLANCQLDATVDEAAVRQKLDQMWLSMQLLAAEQQLKLVEAATRQVQVMCKALEQQQQQQHGQQDAQVEQLRAMLQQVQEVHSAADSVLQVLGPRCFVDAGKPVLCSAISTTTKTKPAPLYGRALCGTLR